MRTHFSFARSGNVLRIALLLAIVSVLVVPTSVAAKRAAFFCESAPGDTYVRLRGGTETARVEFGWSDAEGTVIAQRTIMPKGKRGFRYSEPTPAGAVEFSVSYYDASGVAYAVGGMVCQ
jgi:hypothetical protein